MNKMLDQDKTDIKNQPVGNLEFTLFASLNPVEPDPEFVSRVRHRIERRPTMILEARTFWEIYVIVASGFFVGAMLLWLTGHKRLA
jgi:hypothetical protein